MPRRSSVALLPAKVRDELHRRLVAADFGDLVGTSAWLAKQGHSVGKSALGLYAKRNRAVIEASAVALEPVNSALRDTALRLECLKVAASSQGTTDGSPGCTAQILERCESFIAYVAAGQEPRGDS